MQVFSAGIQPGQTGHEAAWQLLKEAYEKKTGKTLPPVARTERGKPYFPDGHLHFSLTHTPRRVFCVFSDRPVGIDAEEMDRPVREELAYKILSPEEKHRWEGAPDRRQALLKLWVLKEAQAKCAGQGLRGYPRDTDFSLEDPRVARLDGCFVAVIEM